MSRIAALFQQKQHNVLNIYCTVGYPYADATLPVMQALQQHGADMIELGMPYSDPLADGPVIQASSSKAIQDGMTIERLFQQLQGFRKHIQVPVVLMGYMNPVLQYGFERFCSDAAKAGIDGLILPDLPEYEFETMYRPVLQQYGLNFIFLVTPETSDERLRKLDSLSSGFLYAVSSSSVTGSDKSFSPVESYLQKLQNAQLNNPFLVGFGIKDAITFNTACKYANGAIIGSAYVKALENATDVNAVTQAFIAAIKN